MRRLFMVELTTESESFVQHDQNGDDVDIWNKAEDGSERRVRVSNYHDHEDCCPKDQL